MAEAKRKGTSWTGKEIKYIGDYAQRHGLQLTMCSYPTVKYIRKDTGETITLPIATVASESAQQIEEDRKHRAYEKRLAKQEEERKSWGLGRYGGN